MTEHETEIPAESAEQIRQIAREEARDVYDDEVVEADGEEWSVRSMMDRFEIPRRTALGAMGLLIVGSVTDPVEAVMRSYVGTAEAQANDLTVPGTLSADAVSAEQLNTDYHFAKSYSGADPDSRLDAAISAASNGETIYLENGTHDSDRTVSKNLRFVGPSANAGATIDGAATWTLTGNSEIENIDNNGTIQINSSNCTVTKVQNFNGAINIGGDFCIIDLIQNGSVTFESGTSGGILDTAANVSVTDNGTNKIGDNS